jgi:ion channel POLLUX/CASTOR
MDEDAQILSESIEPQNKTTFSIWDRIQFRYERFLTLRGSFIFLNLLFIFIIAYLFLLSLHTLLINDTWQASLGEESLRWHVFLEMLTPSRLSVLKSPPLTLLILSVFTTFVGFGFYSLLIAYASTKTQETLNFFRSGLGPVIEEKHTLILGFDDRLPRLIQELNYSNHRKKRHPIVIMADLDKGMMSQRLSAEIDAYTKVRVSLASGEPSRLNSLSRINAVAAKSAIVLARCSHTSSQVQRDASDVRVIQTVKALYASQKPNRRYPIVAEIFDPKRREMIDSIDETIVTYDSYELIASILVQSAISPGVERVYNELFSFEMSEFYFYDGVPVGTRFGDLIYHFQDGVPVGVQTSFKQLTMLPSPDYVFDEGDELLLIARDDQYIHYTSEVLYSSRTLNSVEHPVVIPSQRVLLIGWHYLAPAILRECCRRLPSGSTVTIVMPDDSEHVNQLISNIDGVESNTIIHEQRDPFTLDALEQVDPFKFDTVILLSRGDHIDSEEQMDADTLVLVLLLRRLRDKQIGRHITTRIVTQLFRPENEQLIDNHRPKHDDPVDFVLTSKTSTMLFTQLSEQGDMVKTYNILFGDCSYEIALCPILDYVTSCDGEISFIDLYISALKRGEVCIGFKSPMPEIQAPPYLGVYLNPPKQHQFPFTDSDELVLLRPKS